MSIPFACVPVSLLLAYAPRFLAAASLLKDKGYDNQNPREQQAKLTGWRARAVAAHYNGLEAFPQFAAGVLIATVAHADAKWITILALVHVGARLVYPALYLANIAPVRTLVWTVGWAASLALMVLPLVA